MTAPIPDAAVYSDINGLAALKRSASAEDPAALRQVAKQFESIFTKMMLTSMRQATSSFRDPLFGSDQTEFYQGMFDDQLSLELSKGRGIGLADMLVRQLQKVAGASEAGGAAPAVDPKTGAHVGLPISAAKSSTLKMPTGGSAPTLPYQSAQRATALAPPSAALGGAAGLANLAGSASAPKDAFLSEPDAFDPKAALDVASQFIQKMLSGNATANGLTPSFQTPSSPEDFVKQLWPCAEAAGKELGVNPTHLLAQAALETGWGRRLPCDTNGNPSFNFFGIKAGSDWTGDAVSARTLEFEGGLPVPQNARFRSYDSAQDSFRDYVSVLRDNPRYAAALNTGNDAKAFATALQRGGYATDPAYAQKIASIAQNLGNSAATLKSSDAQPIPSTPDHR